MSELTTIYAQLDQPVVYDNSIIKTEIDEVSCDKISIANLNQANNQFKFYYSADFDYLVSFPNTGFLLKARFCTRNNNNTDANANIILASNRFCYLFNDISLRLGGQVIESIHSPGVLLDVFYNMENDEFRKRSGALCGFIPNTSSEISDTIGTRLGNVDGADVAAVLGSFNNANQRNVQTNTNYNEGFVKRRRLYNYTIAANDDYRDIELFIPLNRIFFFVMKLIEFLSIFLLKLY